MKLATATTTDFSALKAISFAHTADFESIELSAKQQAYARLYERYKLLMAMHEDGMTVTVTMRSAAGTITIEDDSLFEPMDYQQQLGQQMSALAAEILALLQKQHEGTINGDDEPQTRQHNTLSRQLHALCLPAPLAVGATVPTTAHAAHAA